MGVALHVLDLWVLTLYLQHCDYSALVHVSAPSYEQQCSLAETRDEVEPRCRCTLTQMRAHAARHTTARSRLTTYSDESDIAYAHCEA